MWNIPNFSEGVFKSEVSVTAGRIAARGKMSHCDVASHAFFLRQKAMPQSQCDKLRFAHPKTARDAPSPFPARSKPGEIKDGKGLWIALRNGHRIAQRGAQRPVCKARCLREAECRRPMTVKRRERRRGRGWRGRAGMI